MQETRETKRNRDSPHASNCPGAFIIRSTPKTGNVGWTISIQDAQHRMETTPETSRHHFCSMNELPRRAKMTKASIAGGMFRLQGNKIKSRRESSYLENVKKRSTPNRRIVCRSMDKDARLGRPGVPPRAEPQAVARIPDQNSNEVCVNLRVLVNFHLLRSNVSRGRAKQQVKHSPF